MSDRPPDPAKLDARTEGFRIGRTVGAMEERAAIGRWFREKARGDHRVEGDNPPKVPINGEWRGSIAVGPVTIHGANVGSVESIRVGDRTFVPEGASRDEPPTDYAALAKKVWEEIEEAHFTRANLAALFEEMGVRWSPSGEHSATESTIADDGWARDFVAKIESIYEEWGIDCQIEARPPGLPAARELLRAKLAEVRKAREALELRVSSLLDLLRRCESGPEDRFPECPICLTKWFDEDAQPHEEGCELAAALGSR